MIRYSYNVQHRPAAPFVLLTIRHPQTGAEIRDVPAQIDSAADRTLLPLTVAEGLSLDKIGEIAIGGVGGSTEWMVVYEAEVGIHPLPLLLVRVVVHADEQWALLGRDVLNGHRLVLDCPAAFLEIG